MDEPQTWSLLLIKAKAEKSELLYNQALRLAETEHGEASSEAGLCLMEIADFYEESGRENEAEEITKRYRAILVKLAGRMGIIEKKE